MTKIYRNYKRLSVWILLFTQVLLIMSYFYLRIDEEVLDEKITFVESSDPDSPKITYHTISSRIFLKSINSRTKFLDFNSSLCYTNGTDLISMKKSHWECHCLPGWHGKDCGQPEIIWRAFLTYRKPIKIVGPRTFERRLIYIFSVDKFGETTTEIRVNELGDIVDLFVLHEDDTTDHLQRKLTNNFLKKFHEKILYLKTSRISKGLKNVIKNLRDDDVVLTSNNFEIPNKFAVNFLKFYNKWPEPVGFRLRWSVYGFFWVHPERTVTSGGACSVGYLRGVLNNQVHLLGKNTSGIILGDLNHLGGWFCDYCFDVDRILESLSSSKSVNLDKVKKIDASFLEDAIENGVYLDGKTELVRTHRYRDSYFAPFSVMENTWNYDFLLTNFYSKIDYYEG